MPLSQAELHKQGLHVTGSGFRASMGHENRCAEPLSALRRAPIFMVGELPTPCWRPGPPSIRAFQEELEGGSPGKLMTLPSKVQPAVRGKAHRQSSSWYPHRQLMGTTANAVFCSTLHQSGAALSIKWGHGASRKSSGKFISKIRGPSASISKMSSKRPRCC